MKVAPAISAFTAGELSPLLQARSDTKQYGLGCLALENMVVTVQGPVRRRPGFRYCIEVKDSSARTAITEFIFSVATSFVLEWGNKYVRFIKNHAAVAAAGETFSAVIGGTTVDGALTWTCRGFPGTSGRAGTLNEVIIDPHGNLQICISAGIPLSPVWNTTVGGLTLDGAAIWQNLGVPQWQSVHTYAANAAIYSPQGVQQVTAGGGGNSGAGNANVPYEIPSPYATADLFDANGFFQLVFIQSADVVYVCHRSRAFPVYKLSHFGDMNWTFAQVAFVGGPFADENPGTNPIVFASAQSGNGITLSASSDIFASSLMGAYFQLTQQNIRAVKSWQSGKVFSKGSLARYNGVTYKAVDGYGVAPWTAGTTPPTHLSGDAYDGGGGGAGGAGVVWHFEDAGYGMVRLKTRGANPAGSAVVITGITVANPPVVTTSGVTPAVNGDLIFITGVEGMTEVNDKFYKVAAKAGSTFALQDASASNIDGTTWKAYTAGGTADNRVWTATADVIQQPLAGIVNQLPATVIGSDNATSLWAVGAWNDRDGYPTCVSFFRGRLCFARRGRVWLSVSQDFENFSALTPNALITADMAISITLPTQDDIQWLAEGRILAAGTESAEHAIQEINPSQPLGPSNVSSKVQLRHGSRAVRPVIVGSSLLWTQTSGVKVRAMKYAFATDNYESQDMTAMAEHITKSGIVGMAWQQEPDAIVWMWRADGQLIGLTFNEEQQVIAWHRHPMVADAAVESAAVIPRADGSGDELWAVIKRTINGITKRYIEYQAQHFETGDDPTADLFYQDAGFAYDGAAISTITGLGYLEGRTVKVLADGAWHRDLVVASGQVTLDRAASVVRVGLAQTAKLTTMPFAPDMASGSAAGKIKRVTSINLRFINTMNGELGNDDEDQFENCEFRKPNDPMDAAVPLYTGMFPPATYDFPWPEGYEQDAKLTYKNADPFPVTIVGIYPDVGVGD